jgi:hypothetical protein
MAMILDRQEEITQAGPVAVEKSKRRRVADKKQEQPQAAAVARQKIGVPAFLHSPWLLVTVPLLVGGFWLVNNSWVIIDNIDKPYALLAGPALVGSFLAGWLVIKFFAAIERAIRSAWGAFLRDRERDASAQFFWIVIAVFLAVSVFASGNFFRLLEHDAVPGLGYATALFIDLVAVQCMRARLNAGRLRDRRGQLLYLLGVLVCASASAFANVYTSLSTFTDKAAGALPSWMPTLAPWFGLVFPLLIVLLSMTADYTVDQTSSKLNPEQYKEQEGKRVRLLEIQRDLLRDRVTIEQEIDDLTAKLRGRKERRVFFLWAWLFPLQQSDTRILEQVERLYKPQLDALTEQNELLCGQLAGLMNAAQSAYVQLDQSLQHFVQAVDSQRDTDNRLLVERLEGLAVAPAPVPDYQALAEGILPWLSPVLDGLRQEVRAMVPAGPKEMKVNYVELARVLAPLLVAREEESGLTDANTDAFFALNGAVNVQEERETEAFQALGIEILAASNGHQKESQNTDRSEGENESQDADFDALLQRPTVALKDAARLLGCEVKYVRTLRTRGKVKASPRNNDLITTASIKNYLVENQRVVKA